MLRATKNDGINTQLLEQEQALQERALENERLTTAKERLERQVNQLSEEKETLITQ